MRPKKNSPVVEKTQPANSFDAAAACMQLFEITERLAARISDLEEMATKKVYTKSITKLEDYNGEVMPEKDDSAEARFTYDEKIQCMVNAVTILPPNHINEGRQPIANVDAICPFKVTEEMMDDLYSRFSHEA